MRVGFIGAGRMGRPMVDRLVGAGHEVRVLGRTEEQRAELRNAGAHPVEQAPEAGRDAAVVCVCVFSDEQVRQVCLDSGLLDAMPNTSVLVLHTTGSPRTAQAIAEKAAPRGIGVLDSPVSGGPHDIAAGRVTLLVGGAGPHVDRARPVLTAYGDPILHVGPLGAGQGVKLVNNAVFAANIGLLAQAAKLAAEFGVEEPVLLSALPHGSSASFALSAVARRESVTAFAEAVREFLAKDVAVVRRVAADQGATLGVLDAAISELSL
jgi:3-hydroxyisobutyrate dehydrogenase-like beta-hydroxyacid dehydrogenase